MTPEDRIRMLRTAQQHSQAFGNSGPILVGNPEPERDDDLVIPGAQSPEPQNPTQRRIAVSQGLVPGNPEYEAAKKSAEARARASRGGFNIDMALDRGEMQRSKAEADAKARADAAAEASRQKWSEPTTPPEPDAPSPAIGALTPADAAALRKKYEQGGHTQTMTFEDWYDANFSGATPEDVRRSSTATPRIQAGRDPNLPPGEASSLAKSRQEAGKPLPEGRDPSQYSPDQRRTMQRNVHSPEVPMQRHGGTFAYNVDGTVSSRAPNPQALRDAAAIAADPEQGPGSASHTMALAMAYGIDASQYGDDMDLLKADVAREKERHDRLAQKYDVVDNGMGGFRYTPNSATKEMAERRKAVIRADEYGQRFAGMLTPEQENEITAELEAMGATPHEIMRLQRNRGIAQAVRNNAANRNMTIAMNNPRVAQGLYMRSLQQAAQTGDPLQIAAVHESFGNERAASDYRNLAGVQSQAAAEAMAAEAEARASQVPEEKNPTIAEQLGDEMRTALAMQSPEQREVAVRTVLGRLQYPPEQIDAAAKRILSASAGSPVPASPNGFFNWLWGLLSTAGSAPPQAWGGGAPPAGGASYAQQAQQVPMFTVPGAPATSQFPRR